MEGNFQLIHGDNLDIMRAMEDASVDSCVTDGPYGLKFMGKKWDYDVPSVETWEEVYRILKPGGYLLAFGGTRTYHRMTVNIEDAGFEIRDMVGWIYGSGFPKSHNVGKAIDKRAGAEREVVGLNKNAGKGAGYQAEYVGGVVERTKDVTITAPATPAAQQWDGWGTALKPAHEPICMARKPFKTTVAENVLTWGTGAINVDGCRVEGKPRTTHKNGNYTGNSSDSAIFPMPNIKTVEPSGRWPANIIHDGSDEVLAEFAKAGERKSGGVAGMRQRKAVNTWGGRPQNYPKETSREGDTGTAARFFYCAKASRAERNAGLPEGMVNDHPTVKPIALMEYLTKLVTQPGGVVIDPFMGSGTTGVACAQTGRNFIGIEIDETYFKIAEKRINKARQQLRLGI